MGFRDRPQQETSVAPEPIQPLAAPQAPVKAAEVDLYADKPYVAPAIEAARAGEQVEFGEDFVEVDGEAEGADGSEAEAEGADGADATDDTQE